MFWEVWEVLRGHGRLWGHRHVGYVRCGPLAISVESWHTAGMTAVTHLAFLPTIPLHCALAHVLLPEHVAVPGACFCSCS